MTFCPTVAWDFPLNFAKAFGAYQDVCISGYPSSRGCGYNVADVSALTKSKCLKQKKRTR